MSPNGVGGGEYYARTERNMEANTQTTTAPEVAVDIASAALQATADLATGSVIVDIIAAARESAGLTPLPEDFTYEVTYPPYGGGGGGAPAKPIIASTPPAMGEVFKSVKTASMPFLDDDALRAKLEPMVHAHMIITVALGIASVIGTLIPFLRLDRILEAIHSMYALLDPPVIFSQIREERLAVEWRRPYRYWIESQLQNNIPPTADLITFLVREQITLDDFIRVMSYWGYSPDVANMYWGAHWVMPTTEQIFDLLALGYINDEQAKQQLVINDIAPEWIDRIFELRVRLPSRTELRLIMRRMKLPDELVNRVFDFERIHPDYQEYYRNMLINWDMDSLYGKIVTEALGEFVDGLITEEQLRVLCTDALQSPAETDANVTLGKLRLNADRADSMKRRYINLYKKGYQPRDVVTATLTDIGYDAIDVTIWLDNAEVDQLPKLDIIQYEEPTEEESGEPPEE